MGQPQVSTQAEGFESSPAKREMGVLVDERLDMSQYHVLKGKKVNLMHQKKAWPTC